MKSGVRFFEKLDFYPTTPLEEFSSEASKLVRSMKISNFSRKVLVTQFLDQILPELEKREGALSLAIVGGDLSEPELLALQKLGIYLSVTVLGVETSGESYLDLNIPMENVQRNFDIVICSQVLEHVWDIDSAFRNLNFLLGPNSLLWISTPASNRFHGSPEYFFAGFSEKLLRKMALKFDFKDVRTGTFGSHRNYLATHSLDIWLSPRGHRFPLLSAFDSKTLPIRLILTMRFFARLVYLSFISGKLTSNPRYASESWLFARKHD